MNAGLPRPLVGDDLDVPCIDGTDRRYLNLDGAASTNALPAVAARVHDCPLVLERASRRRLQVPRRHRRLRTRTRRDPPIRPANIRHRRCDHLPQHHRSHQPPRLPAPPRPRRRRPHHRRRTPRQPPPLGARRPPRFVDCTPDGTFTADDVIAALDTRPRPKLLAITGASNVTDRGGSPPMCSNAERTRRG